MLFVVSRWFLSNHALSLFLRWGVWTFKGKDKHHKISHAYPCVGQAASGRSKNSWNPNFCVNIGNSVRISVGMASRQVDWGFTDFEQFTRKDILSMSNVLDFFPLPIQHDLGSDTVTPMSSERYEHTSSSASTYAEPWLLSRQPRIISNCHQGMCFTISTSAAKTTGKRDTSCLTDVPCEWERCNHFCKGLPTRSWNIWYWIAMHKRVAANIVFQEEGPSWHVPRSQFVWWPLQTSLQRWSWVQQMSLKSEAPYTKGRGQFLHQTWGGDSNVHVSCPEQVWGYPGHPCITAPKARLCILTTIILQGPILWWYKDE